MPAFFSDKGTLSLPSLIHPVDERYTPVQRGKPISVELAHLAFGAIEDWWGKSEILVSSWAKTGGTAKPGVRIVNALLKEIAPYEHLESMGAKDYGHSLVYYSPAYDGGIVRFSVEFLEIDALKKKNIANLAGALRTLGTLPVFAPHLAYLAVLPDVAELGRKVYQLFNKNDTWLLQHLDLSMDIPHMNRLSSGRYVLVGGNWNPKDFISTFRLGTAHNRLETLDGKPAEDSGLSEPYMVVRINAEERSEYVQFEPEAEANSLLEDILIEQDVTREIADSVIQAVSTAKAHTTTSAILSLNHDLGREEDEQRKKEIKKEIGSRLKRLPNDTKMLLEEALGL